MPWKVWRSAVIAESNISRPENFGLVRKPRLHLSPIGATAEMAQNAVEIRRARSVDGGRERRVRRLAVIAVRYGEGQGQRRFDDVVGEAVGHTQCFGDVPAMYYVVDEVEPDGDGSGERRLGPEVGKRKRRLEYRIIGEGGQDIAGCVGVGAAGVDGDRTHHSVGSPHVGALSESPRCRRESTMLGGHVREQFGEVPANTRGGRVQIGSSERVNQGDGVQHGDPMVGPHVRDISRHMSIIGVCVHYSNAYHVGMPPKPRRNDLAAMLHPLLRDLVTAELPILAAHHVSMWGYVVLSALDKSPIRTQAALAEAIGADKTRIIATLDELQQRGFIERRPDPEDRRVRLLEITPAGRKAKNVVQIEIQRGEERWLSQLTAEERNVFLRVLQRLSGVEAE
jgi:DNA-binding MarR family transcriptional regulator